MRFEATAIPGVWIINPEPVGDERGLFVRTFAVSEFVAAGLNTCWELCALSYNRRAGTLRGMHYQCAPHEEIKLVRCVRGAIHDVVVDLRPGSPTFRKWTTCELTADNRRAFYIPAGCAHGFQTLVDDSEVLYHISAPYHPESARGVRWNDTAFGIAWPEARERILSARDRDYPDFRP